MCREPVPPYVLSGVSVCRMHLSQHERPCGKKERCPSGVPPVSLICLCPLQHCENYPLGAPQQRGFPTRSVLRGLPVSDELHTNQERLTGHESPEGEGFGDFGICLSLGTCSAPEKGTWYLMRLDSRCSQDRCLSVGALVLVPRLPSHSLHLLKVKSLTLQSSLGESDRQR